MTSEPLYKAIDPKTYLELANELSLRSQEPAKRTAVDRAYYAAFLASRDILAAKGYITPYYSSRDHQYVAEMLRHRDILGSLGNDENRLRRARNTITYDTREINKSHEDARPLNWILDTAKRIVEGLGTVPDDKANLLP